MSLRAVLIILCLFTFTAPALAQVSEDDDLMTGAVTKPLVDTPALPPSAPAADAAPVVPFAPTANAAAEGEGLAAPDPDIAGATVATPATPPSQATPPAQAHTVLPIAQPTAEQLAAQAAIDKQNAETDAAYDAAFAKLTKAQQAELEDFDQKFTVTLRPVVQVFRVGAALEYCITPPHLLAPKEKQEVAAFRLYKDRQDELQAALWDKHREALKKVTYMDAQLLEAHFQSQADIALQIAQKMVEDGGKAGAFDKTDCRSVQDVLQAAVLQTAKMYQDAAISAKTPPAKGTATPPAR